MTAGIVYYKPDQNDLTGYWSHSDIGGALAKETIIGASLDNLPGSYAVEIDDPRGVEFIRGELSISELGKCYRLNWVGTLLTTGEKRNFVGIGHVIEGLLIASFEPELPAETSVKIWQEDLASAQAALPDPVRGQVSARLLRGSAKVLFYAPHPEDPQQPHKQDEVYIVASGSAAFETAEGMRPVTRGEAIFVAAGQQHRFVDISEEFSTWVLFYGPEGGE